MSSEAREQILQMIEGSDSRPSAVEFEMAYQARVAIDRIRFAIKHMEQFGPCTDRIREADLQLMDALQRLESLDRRFQERSRLAVQSVAPAIARPGVNCHDRTGGTTPRG